MQILTRIKLNSKFIFIIPVIILPILSYWRVITFDFWRDDWAYLWTAAHYQYQGLFLITLHPATWLEDILLFPILKWNPILWNILGIIFRIVASLTFYFMMFTFFKSKNVALLAGLFLASSPVGIEAIGWTSAHNTTVMMIVICMVFYFWFLYINKSNYKYLISAYLLLAVAIFLDPGKALPVFPLILTWEFFRWRFEGMKNYKRTIVTVLILVIIVEISYFALPAHIQSKTGLMINDANQSLAVAIPNFFSSIGNLLYGSVISMDEFAGQFPFNPTMEKFALSFTILVGGLTFAVGFVRKSKRMLALAFFVVWIIIFYTPAWLFEKGFIASATHRYLGLSSLGLMAIYALIIGSIKNKKLMIILTLLLVIMNVYNSNNILAKESLHRSRDIVRKIWDPVVRQVILPSTSTIFLFEGNYKLRLSVIDWAGGAIPWPYIVKKGIENNFPKIVTNRVALLRLLCQDKKGLESLYIWDIDQDMRDVTKLHKEDISNELTLARCH